jgi:hypothetical protein
MPSGLNLKERQTDKPGAIKTAATNTALVSATAASVVAVVTATNPVFEEIFGADVTTGQKIAFYIALIGGWALIASADVVARVRAASADKLAIEKSAGELGKQLVRPAAARSTRVIEAPDRWKVEPNLPTPDLNGEFDVKMLRWAGDADEPEYQLVQNGTQTWVRESQLRRCSNRAPGNRRAWRHSPPRRDREPGGSSPLRQSVRRRLACQRHPGPGDRGRRQLRHHANSPRRRPGRPHCVTRTSMTLVICP